MTRPAGSEKSPWVHISLFSNGNNDGKLKRVSIPKVGTCILRNELNYDERL